MDNEGATRSTEIIRDTEIVFYNYQDGTAGVLQYDKTLIINSCLDAEEMKKIVFGIIPE